jgi:hypothetical protein
MYEGASSRTGIGFSRTISLLHASTNWQGRVSQSKTETTDGALLFVMKPQDERELLRQRGEVHQRYKLGQLLSKITRHFLLLTATPHNGKEEDFHLFMAFLDGDALKTSSGTVCIK